MSEFHAVPTSISCKEFIPLLQECQLRSLSMFLSYSLLLNYHHGDISINLQISGKIVFVLSWQMNRLSVQHSNIRVSQNTYFFEIFASRKFFSNILTQKMQKKQKICPNGAPVTMYVPYQYEWFPGTWKLI